MVPDVGFGIVAVIMAPLGALMTCGCLGTLGILLGITTQLDYQAFCQQNTKAYENAHDSICQHNKLADCETSLNYASLSKWRDTIVPYSRDQIEKLWTTARVNPSAKITEQLYIAAMFQSWASAPRGSHVFTDINGSFTEMSDEGFVPHHSQSCPQHYGTGNALEAYLQPHTLQLPNGEVHHILVELSKSAVEDEKNSRPFTLNIYFSSTLDVKKPELSPFKIFDIFDYNVFPEGRLKDTTPQLFRVDFGVDPLVGMWSLYTRRLSQIEQLPNENRHGSWVRSYWSTLTRRPHIFNLPPINVFEERKRLLETVVVSYSLGKMPGMRARIAFSDLDIVTQGVDPDSHVIDIPNNVDDSVEIDIEN